MKRLSMLLIIAVFLLSAAFADPLPILEDYADDVVILYDDNDPSAGKFEYSDRYPHVDESAEGGAAINAFYDYLANNETQGFTIPMKSEDYKTMGGGDTSTIITYTVTCNNDDFFSIAVKIVETTPDLISEKWEGHVFNRKNVTPGSTCTLPQLLGTLSNTENDTWLQDRQTAKAEAFIRSVVWDRIEANTDGIEYYDDFQPADLEDYFFPEEDFYLESSDTLVFFLQPGIAAPESAGLLTFSFSLEDILDEM